jgi:carbonic anhydrase
VQVVRDRHEHVLAQIDDEDARIDRLCEFNVIAQVVHVCQTTIVQDAWARGQGLTVHGWIYRLNDGLLRDLGWEIGSAGQLATLTAQITTSNTPR